MSGASDPLGENDPLSKLSQSIADGEAIDWDEVRALVGADELQQLIEHLRVVANVAEVHRTQIAETIAISPAAARDPAATGPAPPRAGTRRWGHLLLVRKIGEGAFGEVFEALDTWLDHPRALKLLKPEVANRASAPQILHEARKLVRVRHPNVVMVHGADSHDGRVGFWMDLVEGQTLEDRVKAGRLSAGEATYVGKELCRAVSAVHHANLLHRDIKAQNVMRASDGGRIILMDFGAGEFRDAPSLGRPHGTPLYLAPELITGGAATEQSDIYALGVLLYFLVTGRFPVEGRSLSDLALAHAQRARRHLRDIRPDLPDLFVGVVERATAHEPARRYQSAGDLFAALDARDPPTPIHPDTRVEKPPAPVPSPVPVREPERPLALTILAGFAALVAIEVCGLIASRTFEVVLNVGSDFEKTPSEYFTAGLHALFPFALYWIAGIFLVALVSFVRMVLGAHGERLLRPARARLDALPVTTVATMIPVVVALCWMVVTWVHWPIFETLDALHQGMTVQPAAAPILGPPFRQAHFVYSQISAALTLVLILALWRWWPSFERRSDDPATLRRMKWACVALSIVIVVAAIGPRRFAWERFDVVVYKNRDCYVIGEKGDDLLLYVAGATDTVRPRARRADVTPTDRRLTLVGR